MRHRTPRTPSCGRMCMCSANLVWWWVECGPSSRCSHTKAGCAAALRTLDAHHRAESTEPQQLTGEGPSHGTVARPADPRPPPAPERQPAHKPAHPPTAGPSWPVHPPPSYRCHPAGLADLRQECRWLGCAGPWRPGLVRLLALSRVAPPHVCMGLVATLPPTGAPDAPHRTHGVLVLTFGKLSIRVLLKNGPIHQPHRGQ